LIKELIKKYYRLLFNKIKALTNDKCTPLILAAKKGHIGAIKCLLSFDVNIYSGDIRNMTALHYASFNCNI
jgi:ankyrin repeat protein